MSLFNVKSAVRVVVTIIIAILVYVFLFSPNVSLGDKTPSFRLARYGGGELTDLDLRGKPYLLHFWGHWCDLCVRELPEIEKLHRRFGDDFMIVMVHVGDRPKDLKSIQNLFSRLRPSYDIYLDSGKLSELFGVRTVPVSFFVDKDGVILEKMYGPQDWSSEEIIEKIYEVVRKCDILSL